MTGCCSVIYVGNDNLLKFPQLKNTDTGEVITDAALTMKVYSPDGSAVDGQVWPSSVINNGDGSYSGTIEGAAELVEGHIYTAIITGTDGDGHMLTVDRDMIARARV